jgi:glucose-1-phosphate thymidylyltransferase
MTRVVNKHLLPVYDQPMIHYPLATLQTAGIRKVCVVVGGREPGEFQELLGDGSQFGFDSLSFVEQEGEGGIAAALVCAQSAVGSSPMCVVLGDNILEDSLAPFAEQFAGSGKDAMVLLSRVRDPHRFGVPTFDDGGCIVAIQEKPSRPPCDLAVIGVYFYTPNVWPLLDTIAPSDRGELEITDVNNYYAVRNQLAHGVLEGFWGDAGTVESLFDVSARVREWRQRKSALTISAR